MGDLQNSTRPNGTLSNVTCDAGYRLKDLGVRICNIGNWSNEQPICVESKFINICRTYRGVIIYNNRGSHNNNEKSFERYTLWSMQTLCGTYVT